MESAYIYDIIRTPIGKGVPGGALYATNPLDVLSFSLRDLLKKNIGVEAHVTDFFLGCTTPIGDQGGNISRAALSKAQLPHTINGIQFNNFEVSDFEAIDLARLKVQSGQSTAIIAGGLEFMSRVAPQSDLGPMYLNPELIRSSILFPKSFSADLYAAIHKMNRVEIEEYVAEVEEKNKQRSPGQTGLVPIYDQNELLLLESDEIFTFAESENGELDATGYADYRTMALSKFPNLGSVHPVHPPQAFSQAGDGVSLIIIGNQSLESTLGKKPLAKISVISSISIDPTIGYHGMEEATQKAISSLNLAPSQIDLWKCYEPFAAIGKHFQSAFNIPSDRFNLLGSSFSIGKPEGALGGILLCNLLTALEKLDLKRGLLAISSLGGTAKAMVIERLV